MKIVWKNKAKASGGVGGKKRSRSLPITLNPDLPFDKGEDEASTAAGGEADSENLNDRQEALTNEDRIRNLVECFRSQGNQLAEDGKYHEALGKWEAAVSLEPKNAVLHEQKAQVLLEIGDSWNAIKAATQATELEPSWCEAWLTLGRAQLNFGEPDSAIESFDKVLEIKASATFYCQITKRLAPTGTPQFV
ncbi:small glutamine-rich tetratricopeptide repeat-containing protein 2 isoform X3 [Curcuma longa]|uniref:small glutamine-rich tetratricopeptide repeat-containing protein 2 isoform X3 n=1 Tax=Curcuma longa TaxID=136217 RepID=UPI003D9E9C4A